MALRKAKKKHFEKPSTSQAPWLGAFLESKKNQRALLETGLIHQGLCDLVLFFLNINVLKIKLPATAGSAGY